jgi:hypothetical protein
MAGLIKHSIIIPAAQPNLEDAPTWLQYLSFQILVNRLMMSCHLKVPESLTLSVNRLPPQSFDSCVAAAFQFVHP